MSFVYFGEDWSYLLNHVKVISTFASTFSCDFEHGYYFHIEIIASIGLCLLGLRVAELPLEACTCF